MHTYLVTRDVVISDDTIAPVVFTVSANSGADAGRFADRGKRNIEVDAGTAPPVSRDEHPKAHLYSLPFAGLSEVLFPNRKVKSRKRNKR